MPLFVSVNAATFPVMVKTNLFEITAGDFGLGDALIPGDPTAERITYAPTMSGVGQNRLNAIVNSAFPNPIVLFGVDSSFVFFDGIPISNLAGRTFPPDAAGIIQIAYDVTQCAGTIYWVVDGSGTKISFPNFVLLFHELSHAFHLGSGTLNAAAPEFQAITDENQLRSQFGMQLRDPNNNVGACGFAGVPTPSPTCFIVSAASGSARAPQVDMFIRTRDVLLRRSSLGAAFFGDLFAEYDQFSPRIAADMNAAEGLKKAISRFAVEPILDFFALLELYVRGGWRQQESFADEVERVLARALPDEPPLGPRRDQIETAHHASKRLQERLDGMPRHGRSTRPPQAPSGDSDPVIIADYLGSVAVASAPATEYSSWALAAPLTIYWSTLARLDPREPDMGNAGMYFAEELTRWLGSVPVPAVFDQLPQDVMQRDLAQLSEIIFTVPPVRHRLGARLLNTYRNRVRYDLEEALREVGYLPTASGSEEDRYGP